MKNSNEGQYQFSIKVYHNYERRWYSLPCALSLDSLRCRTDAFLTFNSLRSQCNVAGHSRQLLGTALVVSAVPMPEANVRGPLHGAVYAPWSMFRGPHDSICHTTGPFE
jgi:hypothetical protein